MKKVIAFIGAFILSLSAAFSQISLSTEVHAKVMNSVFEILVEKHEDTQIVYEKKLPMERLPFTIRNDKYYPIGTAFLLDDGTFWSASHVISTEGQSVYDKYFIRDQNGDVFPIEEINKFSTSRDFINFTVPSYKIPEGSGLTIQKNYKLNTNVFSVGNALGEGIIIRNGTLTSATHEDENGEWKWLRFSAAASPGNSGGPLINESGEVLGIITMKSQNENLNYALPVNEALTAPEKTGLTHKRFYYTMPNISGQRFYNEFDYSITLPKKLAEVNSEVTAEYQKYVSTTVDGIRADYSAASPKGFLKHPGKAEIIYKFYGPVFPLTMYFKDTEEWDYAQPEIKNIQLEDNGFVQAGEMLGYSLLRIHRPDSVPLESLIKNPKLVTEYCLKASPISRQVANEKIKVKSLGEPYKSEIYTDIWGRNWFVNYFKIDFADATYVTFALPIPTGLYVMANYETTSSVMDSEIHDMKFICDNVYLRYGGKIKDWLAYCNLSDDLKALRSPQEKEFEIKIEDNHLKGHFQNVTFDVSKEDFNFDEESSINIISGFALEDGKPAFKVRLMAMFTDQKKGDYKFYSVCQRIKPLNDALETTVKAYNQIAKGLPPYDGNPYNEENCTYLDKSVIPEGTTVPENAEYVLVKCLELEGQNKFEEAKAFYEKMNESIKFTK